MPSAAPSCSSRVPCVPALPRDPRALPCGQALVVTFLNIFVLAGHSECTKRVFWATFGFRGLGGRRLGEGPKKTGRAWGSKGGEGVKGLGAQGGVKG